MITAAFAGLRYLLECVPQGTESIASIAAIVRGRMDMLT